MAKKSTTRMLGSVRQSTTSKDKSAKAFRSVEDRIAAFKHNAKDGWTTHARNANANGSGRRT